jgi:hypothetical protein
MGLMAMMKLNPTALGVRLHDLFEHKITTVVHLIKEDATIREEPISWQEADLADCATKCIYQAAGCHHHL